MSRRSFSPASITHEEQPWTAKKLDSRTPQDELIPTSTPGKIPVDVPTVALNVSKCSTEKLSIFCPYVPWPYEQNTRLGNGYTLARVNNAGGPFDGAYYVSSATMSIQRITLWNPWILPEGKKPRGARENFYKHNKYAGRDIVPYLNLVRAHEGEGLPSQPEVGHTGALRIKIETDPYSVDPNIAVEDKWGLSQLQAQALVDSFLSTLEQDLKLATEQIDRNKVIWGGLLEFWDARRKQWVPSKVTVPG